MSFVSRRSFIVQTTAAAAFAASGTAASSPKKRPPNIIFIMLDELGYFELSCMGNKHLITPNIDKMAAEGMRFTQALAGSPICAPTRSVLMTGKHSGHTTVRSNGGGDLRAEDVTIAQVLKKAGYATGGFGKWGIGERGTTGVPEKHGFDIFYGYYNQVHAHSYYPNYLVKNSEKVPLEGNTGDIHKGKTFSHYLIFDETMKFIRENKDHPFFCYCPWTPPHGQWGFPEDDPSWEIYGEKEWDAGYQKSPNDAQKYAAMVNMADRHVGEIFKLLKKLDLEENTIVFFCGDNGGQPYFYNDAHPEGFFKPNGGVFRGRKGNLYEGGLRIPMIVRWPGKIDPGQVSDFLWYFPDVTPTLTELAGTETPADTDGISIVPTLLGEDKAGKKQKEHEFLYWEFMGSRAVRMENWKAIAPGKGKRTIIQNDDGTTEYRWSWSKSEFELYNLSEDIGEQNNIADKHPDILNKMIAFAKQSHAPNFVGKTLDPEMGFQG